MAKPITRKEYNLLQRQVKDALKLASTHDPELLPRGRDRQTNKETESEMRFIREVRLGYSVTANGKQTELCLAKGMSDIVKEERGSFKGTRLAFSFKMSTIFPTRKAANRAIERTKRASDKFGHNAFTGAEYEVLPVVALVPKEFRRV